MILSVEGKAALIKFSLMLLLLMMMMMMMMMLKFVEQKVFLRKIQTTTFEGNNLRDLQ